MAELIEDVSLQSERRADDQPTELSTGLTELSTP
jgi:hypothetical protein